MKKIKILNIFIILLLTSSLVVSISYARYISEVNDEDEMRVAKSGELSLVEKLNGEIQQNNKTNVNIVNYEITLGSNIDKEVYLEFINTEVSTYIFLVIDSINWSYDTKMKQLNIVSNNSKLLAFDINSSWIYLENLSTKNKHIFYQEVDVNTNTNTKFEIMNQINTGLITSDDIDLLNSSQIKFNAYSIQKKENLSIEETWDYLNID